MDEMIPKKIWQTYKTTYDLLPDYAMSATKTWIDKNPDWEYNYFSDEDVMDFVRDNFGQSWVEIFESCPLGVMRADIWRVMVLYINGGMYTDLDTICNVSISEWFDQSIGFKNKVGEHEWVELSNKRILLNAEHEMHLEQWTFLSEAEHPCLAKILENIENSFINPDYSNPHFVHHMTGPGVFTKSILEYLDLWESVDSAPPGIYSGDGHANKNLHRVNLIDEVFEINDSRKSIENGVFIIPSFRFFHNEVSSHLYGSQVWNDGRYTQWIRERDQYGR